MAINLMSSKIFWVYTKTCINSNTNITNIQIITVKRFIESFILINKYTRMLNVCYSQKFFQNFL